MAYSVAMSSGGPSAATVPSRPYDADVVVIGGGPAGSAASAWLARGGRRVILVERDRFPRFHVGESLLASVNDVLDAIGVNEQVRAAGFPEKWGASFMSADGRVDRYADFADAPGVRAPQTWQVPRATFDELLLRHAAASGADVREGHRVVEVEFDPDGVTLTVQPPEAPAGGGTLRARAVIDASGRGAVLSRKFGLRIDEPRLANIAVFSHYSGVPRRPDRRRGDIRIVARPDLGWFWLIPISDELMSIGVVLPRAAFRAFQHLGHEAILERAIAETPAVAQLTADARREWPVRVEKDFSFGSRAYAGDRWLLAGDAGSFLDPVFSTGVAVALESGLEAGQAVSAGLDAGDLSVRQFSRFSRRQRLRYRSFRRFVLGFYSAEFRDLFFNEKPPPRMFNSLVSVFAGYWRSTPVTRVWVFLFFLMVRLQRWVKFSPEFRAQQDAPDRAPARAGRETERAG
jgi:flavin-dependent dehydrogenase